MKKIIALLAAVLICAGVFVGCESATEKKEREAMESLGAAYKEAYEYGKEYRRKIDNTSSKTSTVSSNYNSLDKITASSFLHDANINLDDTQSNIITKDKLTQYTYSGEVNYKKTDIAYINNVPFNSALYSFKNNHIYSLNYTSESQNIESDFDSVKTYIKSLYGPATVDRPELNHLYKWEVKTTKGYDARISLSYVKGNNQYIFVSCFYNKQ